MSNTVNVFGLSQPVGTSDPIAILSGSLVYSGISGVVAALYGPGLTATQIAAQTVVTDSSVTTSPPSLGAAQIGEEIFTKPGGASQVEPGNNVFVYDNHDDGDLEVPFVGLQAPDSEELHVLLSGYFQILPKSAHGAIIVANATEGGGVISHQSNIVLSPGSSDATKGNFYIEDDAGVQITSYTGNNFINETGSGYEIAVGAGSSSSVMLTTEGNGVVRVGTGGVMTQTGTGSVSALLFEGSTYIHTGSGSVTAALLDSVENPPVVIDMVHGNLALTSNYGGTALITLGDGATDITLSGTGAVGDTIDMGSGSTTITGGHATVFGGAGNLSYGGGSGIMALGAGQSTIGGGAAGTQRPFENGCVGSGCGDSSCGCGPQRAVAGWPRSPASRSGIRVT